MRTHGTTEIAGYKSDGKISYSRMHNVLKEERGPARLRQCVDCGLPALHWSLMANATDVVTDRNTGRYYSLSIWAYEPRCSHDHIMHDRKHGLRIDAACQEEI